MARGAPGLLVPFQLRSPGPESQYAERRLPRARSSLARTVGTALAVALLTALPLSAQLRPVVVRVSGPKGLDSLARLGFEVAGVRRTTAGLEAIVVASPATERLLAGAGLAVAPVPGAPLGAAGDSFSVYRSFDKPITGIRATLAAWAAADTVIHVDSIGASVQGRPILAVKIGAAADAPSRPNVLFMGTHHAREWVSTEMAMRLIRWLADSAPPGLLASRDVWVIPVENPDGYQYTFTNDRFWRKNRRDNGDGTFGVDPNRNYPEFWGYDNAGSSGATGNETYRGPGPASEPETKAIIAFHAAHPPVVSVSYHSYSGLVLFPYGFRDGALAPDLPIYRALGGTSCRQCATACRIPSTPTTIPGRGGICIPPTASTRTGRTGRTRPSRSRPS
jgi:Zinc carboxypeptidase